MTTWKEISDELAKVVGAVLVELLRLLKYGGPIFLLYGAWYLMWYLMRPIIYPRFFPNAFEREGTIVTDGCRTTITHDKKPFDGNVYTCVYERDDPKHPDRITAKYCARVETESGVCTLAEMYSAETAPSEQPHQHSQ